MYKGTIGNQKATLHIYPSTSEWARGYYYLGDGKDGFFTFSGDVKPKGEGKVCSFSVSGLYLSEYAKMNGSLHNEIMQGIWTSADGKKTVAYKLVRQRSNKDLAQQRVYQRFKQRFCVTRLPITKDTKPCDVPKKKFTQQVLTLFFAQFYGGGEVIDLAASKPQHHAYARFGPYQSAFVPLYQVSHPYQSRFDILIMTISQKDGGSRFSPWSTNTFVVTYDKYGNYISSVLLGYHSSELMPPTIKDRQKENPEYKYHEQSEYGKFNQRLQIVTQSKTLMEGGKKKQRVYQILPNGYIVLL
jgi:hypothetical protein